MTVNVFPNYRNEDEVQVLGLVNMKTRSVVVLKLLNEKIYKISASYIVICY